MPKPAYRIVAVLKDPERRGGKGVECATIWPGKFEGSLNLSPVTETVEGPYPKMTLADALSGDYYLNVWPVSSPLADEHEGF
tara:strand:+ start:1353 stop:1598 length:246 start_codon:yes stop_codon:yes gene_type:complete